VGILHPGKIARAVKQFGPDEVYFLAAHHSSSEYSGESDEREFTVSYATHVTAYMNVLEAVRKQTRKTLVLYAS